MTERQQNVTPRPRRQPARQSARSAAPVRRRPVDVRRWLRYAMWTAAVAIPVVAYYVASTSDLFSLKHVEVVGATRTSVSDIEETVRTSAGSYVLSADLETVRKAVESERTVGTASVVRVLPDTIRVEVTEREPAVVVRLPNGRLAWADLDGKVVGDFRPQNGVVPPPLAGYDADPGDRAEAENRDRIAAYTALRDALQPDGLWDRIDEVDIKYPQMVKVQLSDSGKVVWLGNKNYRERLTHGLEALDAVARGEMEAPESFGGVDASLDTRITFFKEPSGRRE